jgi:outer membrane protein OmpA-like peptidoglycan-associated protein
MTQKVFVLLLFLGGRIFAQSDSLLIKVGDKAPSFVLTGQENSIQSFSMPYLKRIVLMHFWSTYVTKSQSNNRNYSELLNRYQSASYKNAEGFEVIAVAVQTDKGAWTETIKRDSLENINNGIAMRGYQDEVCRKFGITSVPTDILINENGIVVAINPRMADIENVLDDAKNNKPVTKDVTGILAQSSNKAERIKYCRLYLFNNYGDSLQKTITSDLGIFKFMDVKLNQDFFLKIDNQANINTSDPIALYSPYGEFLMDGRTKSNGFVFPIAARSNYRLTQSDSSSNTNYLGQIDVIKHLTFYTNGTGLTPKDEQDLKPILQLLQKNKTLKVELTTHTDARMDKGYAMKLTANQAAALKAFFEKNGITADRIRTVPKGNSELRKICDGGVDCREEDHNLNRRAEFLLYSN